MGCLPVPCRPWAMAIFAVSCRPMARLTWYTGGGEGRKEVGEGLREKEWLTRCRGHRSRDGMLKANDGQRRRIGSDESERGRELRLRGGGSDLGLGMGRGGRRLYMGLLRGGVGWVGPANGQKSRWDNRVVPATVPRTWPCRAGVVSWARVAAHAPHWPSCRAGTGTLPVVSCRPWAVPCRRAVGRAAGPWAVWIYIYIYIY
jgi:hypothetical protein